MEVTYRSFVNKRFINPGLLKGPYLILYGTAALVLCVVANLIGNLNIVFKTLIYGFITTTFELISGAIALKLFNIRLWDYTENKFNYKGLICLKFSIYWTILALFFDYFIYPRYTKFLTHVPLSTKIIFGFGMILCMVVDFSRVFREHFF